MKKDQNITYLTEKEFLKVKEDITLDLYTIVSEKEQLLINESYPETIEGILIPIFLDKRNEWVNSIIDLFNFIFNIEASVNCLLQIDTDKNEIVINKCSIKDIDIKDLRLYIIFVYIFESILYKKDSIVFLNLKSYDLLPTQFDSLIKVLKNRELTSIFILER